MSPQRNCSLGLTIHFWTRVTTPQITWMLMQSCTLFLSYVWQHCRIFHWLWLSTEHHTQFSIIAPGWGSVNQNLFTRHTPKLVYSSRERRGGFCYHKYPNPRWQFNARRLLKAHTTKHRCRQWKANPRTLDCKLTPLTTELSWCQFILDIRVW